MEEKMKARIKRALTKDEQVSHYDRGVLIPLDLFGDMPDDIDTSSLTEYDFITAFPILVERGKNGKPSVLRGWRRIAAARAAGFNEILANVLDEHCHPEVKGLFLRIQEDVEARGGTVTPFTVENDYIISDDDTTRSDDD
jgi:hypothetical protein